MIKTFHTHNPIKIQTYVRSVAWIRGSDSHIITVDQETFISDDRFSSLIKTSDNLWTLKVRREQGGRCYLI